MVQSPLPPAVSGQRGLTAPLPFLVCNPELTPRLPHQGILRTEGDRTHKRRRAAWRVVSGQ